MLVLTECDQQASATALADHLLVHGIETSVRGDGPWQVWILDHDRLEAARDLLAEWRAGGTSEVARRDAAKIRKERQRDHEAVVQHVVDPSRRWYTPSTSGLGPVTVCLVIASVLVALASDFGADPGMMTIQNLSIEPWMSHEFLGRVREGEVWRLLTPMLVHFGPFHLAFNMLWLWRLGRQIEHHHGTAMMLAVVVLSEIPGSLGQYWVSGPNFGGMSGVVYGTFGFVWMHARYDRRHAYALDDRDSMLIMLWFVACATGGFGPIANVGHAGGLLAGLLLGLPPYVRHLRAHAQGPTFTGHDWASVSLGGPRRIYRRFVTPYVPLWFVLIAAVVIWAE